MLELISMEVANRQKKVSVGRRGEGRKTHAKEKGTDAAFEQKPGRPNPGIEVTSRDEALVSIPADARPKNACKQTFLHLRKPF